MANDTRVCQECGAELTADSLQGLCPRCVLKHGLASQAPTSPVSADAKTVFDPTPNPGPASGSPSPIENRQSPIAHRKVRYFGDYELLEEIARGGMGVVYKARQVSLNRIVAVKMILAGQLASEAEVKRFHTEAEAAAHLQHPNIVAIHEVGEHEGQHYFSMDYVEGANLGQRILDFQLPIADSATAGGEPRWTKSGIQEQQSIIARLLSAIARAVHYAHQRGLLHRDLKPANILIDANGQPHVTDFGLAKRVEAEGDLTLSGAVLGTPSYMAPEQARGVKPLTTAADIYSLGAILYHLLTGRPPFKADSPLETMRKVAEEEPERPSSVSPEVDRDLETICLKCLEKDPQRRYGSAEAMAEDLDRWIGNEPILARSSSAGERFVKWTRRKPAIAALTATVVLIMIAGVAGICWQWRQAESARRATAEKATAERLAKEETARQRDHVAELLSTAQAERGVRLLKENNPVGLLYLCEARKTVEHLAGSRISRSALWASWHASFADRAPHVLDHENARTFAFSPDGKLLITVGRFGVTKIWNAESWRELQTVTVDTLMVKSIRFASNSHTVIASSGTAEQLWDITARAPLGPLWKDAGFASKSPISPGGQFALTRTNDHYQLRDPVAGAPKGPSWKFNEQITSITMSPDGQLLATAGRTVRLWEAASGKLRRELLQQPGTNFSVLGGVELTFTENGRWLMQTTARHPPQVQFWEVATGKPFGRPAPHVWPSLCDPRISRDGKILVTLTNAVTAVLWDLESGLSRGTPLRHTGSILTMAFSPDDRILATGSSDATVQLWDALTGDPIGPRLVHGGAVNRVAFDTVGKQVATVSADSQVRVWNVQRSETTSKPAREWTGVQALGFNRQGRLLISQRTERALQLIDPSEPDPLGAVWRQPLRQAIRCVGFSQDGTLFAVAHASAQVEIRRTADGEKTGISIAADSPIAALAFSPDARLLAILGENGLTRFWNLENRAEQEPRLRWRTSASSADKLEFSPEAKFLAIRPMLGVYLGDLTRRSPLEPPLGFVLAVSQNWKSIAALDMNGTLTIYRDWVKPRQSGQLIALQDVTRGAFTPDGKLLATTGRDGFLRFWEAETGQAAQAPMKMDQVIVHHLFFNPSGSLLTAIFDGGTVQLWDVATGQRFGRPFTMSEETLSAEFSPDGDFLAIHGFNEKLELWRIPSADMPLDEMQARSWLAGGVKLHPQGTLVSIPPSEWQSLHSRFK